MAKKRAPLKPKHVVTQLQEWCSQHGDVTTLAQELGVSKTSVSLWINGWRPVPLKHCAEITRLTGGYVQPEMLRPDHNFKLED